MALPVIQRALIKRSYATKLPVNYAIHLNEWMHNEYLRSSDNDCDHDDDDADNDDDDDDDDNNNNTKLYCKRLNPEIRDCLIVVWIDKQSFQHWNCWVSIAKLPRQSQSLRVQNPARSLSHESAWCLCHTKKQSGMWILKTILCFHLSYLVFKSLRGLG